MKGIKDLGSAGLKWIQRSSTEDDLVSGDEVFGTLTWKNGWSSLATAESADGIWTFKRSGFLHPKITIRENGREENAHELEVNWRAEATLRFPDGRAFSWSPNFWRTKWTLMNSEGWEIASIELNGFFNVSGNVVINEKSSSITELPLLLLVGWYFVMLVLYDTAASAAVVAAVPYSC